MVVKQIDYLHVHAVVCTRDPNNHSASMDVICVDNHIGSFLGTEHAEENVNVDDIFAVMLQ